MLQNAYLVAKIGADTAENEQHFAEILPKTGSARQATEVAKATAADPSAPASRPKVSSLAAEVLRLSRGERPLAAERSC